MPQLILLNGPPGIGKSTLAQRYADDHPLSLNLDLDRLRATLGRWEDDPIEAGLLTRAMALPMIRTHLAAGHDVIVGQYVALAEFMDALGRAAGLAGFHELILSDSKQNAIRRFHDRIAAAEQPEHVDAALFDGRPPDLAAMYDRLLAVTAARPRTRTVRSIEGDLDGTYQNVLDALEPSRTTGGAEQQG